MSYEEEEEEDTYLGAPGEVAALGDHVHVRALEACRPPAPVLVRPDLAPHFARETGLALS